MEISTSMRQAFEESSMRILPIDGVNGMDMAWTGAARHWPSASWCPIRASRRRAFRTQSADTTSWCMAGTPRLEHTLPDQVMHPTATGGIEIARRSPHVAAAGKLAFGGGTLGMIFRDVQSNEPLALSCAHVMCGTDPFGAFAADDVIQQPAPEHLGPPEPERLGVLRRWVIPNTPPFFGGSPKVPSGICDAAVCSVERGFAGSDVEDIGTVDGLGTIAIGDPVKKRGKVTGLTFGTVTALLATSVVHDEDDVPIWWMLGQMRIEVDLGFSPSGVWSRPGDSGAVILNLADELVGPHWGGDGDRVGFATDIFTVTTALNLVPG